MKIRLPAVSGHFYPSNGDELHAMIYQCFMHSLGPGKLPPKVDSTNKVYGVICPHAGYQYSGPGACHSIYQISKMIPDLFIIVGPNHNGVGSKIASIIDCDWETPLGVAQVDKTAASELNKKMPEVSYDFIAHKNEHSIEVQIPLLQETFKTIKFLPILLNNQSKSISLSLGKAIGLLAQKRNTLIIGSSDFTHYEPQSIAMKKDKLLIEAILTLDVDFYYDVLKHNKVSACGFGAIATTMTACKVLGATQGKLIQYYTSGDITHDNQSVVGYASIIFI